jgi:hypothetical protein
MGQNEVLFTTVQAGALEEVNSLLAVEIDMKRPHHEKI